MNTNDKIRERINELKSISPDLNPENLRRKSAILSELSKVSFTNPGMMLNYQDILVFIAAHPDSIQIHEMAEKELRRLNNLAATILKKGNENKGISFSGSGFQTSYFISSFSHSICSWLYENFQESVSFHSYDDSSFTPQELLGLSILTSEAWLLENPDMPLRHWIKHAFGVKPGQSLGFILKSMQTPGLPNQVRDLLYDSLKLFITIEILEERNSKSLLRIPKGKLHVYNSPLRKNIGIEKIINVRLPSQIKLNKKESDEFLRVARFALLHLSRETDPVTYADSSGVEVFELGNGLCISLFNLPPDRRNTLDSYVGYMVYKNRIPCAYGGAWVMGDKAKVGLNIFPSFRGGESQWLFAEILRVYKQYFRLRYLEVEPYQIGKGNPEGIASGAFWFYYKLGFRPQQKELRLLAEDEFIKIGFDKKYRSSAQVLKKLAHSIMFLDTDKKNTRGTRLIPDAVSLSKFISKLLIEDFQGDRTHALSKIESIIGKKTGIKTGTFRSEKTREMYKKLLPLFYAIERTSGLKASDKNMLQTVVLAKCGDTEREYVLSTQKIREWLQAIMNTSETF